MENMQELLKIMIVIAISMFFGGFLEYHTKFYTRFCGWLAELVDNL